MTRHVVTGIDGIRSLAGRDLGTTRWRTIDQADVDAFAALTDDRQWIHVDTERAASTPVGTTIVHGYLTLSLASWVLFELLDVDGIGSALNYGLDRVRFPAPLPTGAAVRGHLHVLGVAATPDDGLQASMRVSMERHGGDKPVCVADLLVRYLP